MPLKSGGPRPESLTWLGPVPGPCGNKRRAAAPSIARSGCWRVLQTCLACHRSPRSIPRSPCSHGDSVSFEPEPRLVHSSVGCVMFLDYARARFRFFAQQLFIDADCMFSDLRMQHCPSWRLTSWRPHANTVMEACERSGGQCPCLRRLHSCLRASGCCSL